MRSIRRIADKNGPPLCASAPLRDFSAVLVRLPQSVPTRLHDLLRKLGRRADKLFGHLERRIDDLLTRAVCTHIGKSSIYGVKELPNRFKRRVPGIMKRLDDPISAPGRRFSVLLIGSSISWASIRQCVATSVATPILYIWTRREVGDLRHVPIAQWCPRSPVSSGRHLDTDGPPLPRRRDARTRRSHRRLQPPAGSVLRMISTPTISSPLTATKHRPGRGLWRDRTGKS